jgi:hypothetical protein
VLFTNLFLTRLYIYIYMRASHRIAKLQREMESTSFTKYEYMCINMHLLIYIHVYMYAPTCLTRVCMYVAFIQVLNFNFLSRVLRK